MMFSGRKRFKSYTQTTAMDGLQLSDNKKQLPVVANKVFVIEYNSSKPRTSVVPLSSALYVSYRVLSLQQICVKFIVENLKFVDSFVGLPEIVGKQVFTGFTKNFRVVHYAEALKDWSDVIKLFVDAFKEQVLIALNLAESWLFLSHFVDHLSPFTCIREIDVSYCRIGNNHEILTLLGQLIFLEVLLLNNNYISTEGIKVLTKFRRRAKKGLNNLQYVRLDKNNLSYEALIYLNILPKLHVIVMDDAIFNSFDYEIFKIKFKLCNMKNDPHKLNNVKVDNNGWAIPLLSSFMSSIDKRKTECKNFNVMKNSFYKSKKSNDFKFFQESVCTNVMILCDCIKHHFEKEIISKKNSKIKLGLNSCGNSENIFHSDKQSKVSSYSLIDDSILELYKTKPNL